MFFAFAEAAHPVHTKYIVADFSNGKEIYSRIKQQINVPVGILGSQQFLSFFGMSEVKFVFNDFRENRMSTETRAQNGSRDPRMGKSLGIHSEDKEAVLNQIFAPRRIESSWNFQSDQKAICH